MTIDKNHIMHEFTIIIIIIFFYDENLGKHDHIEPIIFY